jgi:magnesium transporter
MVFFSELLQKNVVLTDGKLIGKLIDIYIVNDVFPAVVSIVIESGKKKHIYAAGGIRLNRDSIIVKSTEPIHKQNGNTVSVRDSLLDKQIIDLVGNKVVRANDVAFLEKPQFMLSGIDVGLSGIVRRIGIDNTTRKIFSLFGKSFEPSILTWSGIQHLEINRGQIQLKSQADKLEKIHPEDLADYLESTGVKNIARFLSSLPLEKASEIFGSLSIPYQTAILREFPPEISASIVEHMDPDEAADVLLTLKPEFYDHILSLVKEHFRKPISRLMELSGSPVGELMTTEFFTIDSQMIAQDILKLMRIQTVNFSSLYTIFVTNRDKTLVGVFSLHELIIQMPQTPAFKFMYQEPITVHLTTPLDRVIKRLLRYKLSVLPVIDDSKKIIGIITLDDVSDYLMTKL